MANYLLIESRDSFGCAGSGFCGELAQTLARQGDEVAVLMVQNGVLTARAGAQTSAPAELQAAGIALLADSFSLRERGIPVDRLAPGIEPSELDVVIDRLIDGWKVIWH